VWGYGNVFGLSADTHLVGRQYSLCSSINAIGQLICLPFSTYFIVRMPARYLMTILILGWGIAQTCLAACNTFSGLMACRFFLGLFEAACLPLYSILTVQWYRRSEQPVRVAMWYSTNGSATIVAALLSFGLGHVHSEKLFAWQLIYLVAGLLTVCTAPLVYWLLDSDIASARFLTPDEKILAFERLRANQQGTGSYEFKWVQVWELFIDPKTYLWFCMSALVNVGGSVSGTFGPTLLANFGFDKFDTALLNMPFGFVQFVAILLSSYIVQKWKWKSPMLLIYSVIIVVGLGMLYGTEKSSHFSQGVAMAGYYLLAPLFGSISLIVAWMASNTAGQTKKAANMVSFNIANSVGNIVGPLLFNAKDAPHYLPGVRNVLGIFCGLLASIVVQVVVLYFMNIQRENQREAHGKPRRIRDTSMRERYEQYGAEEGDETLGQNAVLDLTDVRNDEFVYVY